MSRALSPSSKQLTGIMTKKLLRKSVKQNKTKKPCFQSSAYRNWKQQYHICVSQDSYSSHHKAPKMCSDSGLIHQLLCDLAETVLNSSMVLPRVLEWLLRIRLCFLASVLVCVHFQLMFVPWVGTFSSAGIELKDMYKILTSQLHGMRFMKIS